MGGTNYRRSGLFLVRVWAEQTEDGTGQVACHGRVQRVVDGEAHPFSGWQELGDTLLTMLSVTNSRPHKANRVDQGEGIGGGLQRTDTSAAMDRTDWRYEVSHEQRRTER